VCIHPCICAATCPYPPYSAENARRRALQKNFVTADLAKPEEVLRIISLYADYFEREGGELSLDRGDAAGAWDVLVEDLGDMGVDEMKGKTIEELSNLLGFIGARPVNWNSFRDKDNLVSGWDKDASADVRQRLENGGPDTAPLQLLWHQLCGVAAIADRVWTEEKKPDVHGVLLADDVGVGKTAQVMAFIAFLQLVYQSEEEGGLTRPSIISTPFKLASKHPLLTGRFQRTVHTSWARVTFPINPTPSSFLTHWLINGAGSSRRSSNHFHWTFSSYQPLPPLLNLIFLIQMAFGQRQTISSYSELY